MYILQPFFLLLLALWSPSEVKGSWWDPLLTGKSSCSHPGFFVNPSSCNKFFRCVDHSTAERHVLVRYDFDCPFGTVFDPNVKVCVYPSGGGCSGGGWDSSSGGWTPPASGWSPPKEGWGWSAGSPPAGGWVPPKGGWHPEDWSHHHHHHDDHDHGHNYWSFTPGSSVVVIYDNHGKKRAANFAE